MTGPKEPATIVVAFIKSIREYLERRGITHAEAARTLGMPRPRLTRILSGKVGINTTTMQRLHQYTLTMDEVATQVRDFAQGLDYLKGYIQDDDLHIGLHPQSRADPVDLLGFHLGKKGELVCVTAQGKTYTAMMDIYPLAHEWVRKARGG